MMMMQTTQTVGAKRAEPRRRARSFERAGSLWIPESRQCIGGGVGGSFAARGLGGGKGSPLIWPGAAGLEAFYSWDLKQDFFLLATGVGAPNVTVTWPTFTPLMFELRVATTGSRSTCVLEWRGDGGTWLTLGPGLGATVSVADHTLNLPVGTYTVGQSWKAIHGSWKDNKNSHDFIAQDIAPNAKNPVPKVTGYGTFLSFDGTNTMLRCITSMAANVAGGTSKALYVSAVVFVDSLTFSSGIGTILWFGDGASNHAFFLGTDSTGPAWRSARQDDTGSTLGRSGGTPATGTPYLIEWYYPGTTVTIRVNGTTVVNALGLAPGGNALAGLTLATLGKSFNGGAEGNPLSMSLGNLAIYSTPPSPADQVANAALMRAAVGF